MAARLRKAQLEWMPPQRVRRCTRRRASSWKPALLLAALLARAAPSLPQQPAWSVVPGQPLADAVAQWGASNADMTYSIPEWTVLDLSNATFRRATDAEAAVGGRAYGRGTLSISGAPFDIMSGNSTPKSFINAAQRAGLTPLLVTATLVLSDVCLFNMCLDDLAWPGLGRTFTATLIGIFPINPTVQQVVSNRTLLYVPRPDLVQIVYAVLVASSPWGAVAAAYTRQLVALAPLVQLLEYEIRPYDIYAWHRGPLRQRFPGVIMELRDLRKPGDALMGFMRARGRVMAPRWCSNGTLVPRDIAGIRVDPIWGPVWLEETEQGVLSALVNATALAPQQQAAQMPIPAVMVFTPSLAVTDAWLPGRAGAQVHLNASLILCGSLNATSTPVVDLTARSAALFNVGGPAQLFVGWLALRVPALSQQQLFASALTLSSLAAATATSASTFASTAPLQLYNVTLLVPPLDFLALAVLAANSSAARDCVDAAAVQQADLLQQGVQLLRPSGVSWEGVALAAYTGWGVNATLLTVRPEAALPASITQRCAVGLAPASPPPPPPPWPGGGSGDAGGGGGTSSGHTVAIVVGCTVGGAALVVLAAAALLLWRRQQRRAPPSVYTAPKQSDPERGSSSEEGDAATPDASAARVAGATPPSALAALLWSQERQLLGGTLAQPPGTLHAPQSGGKDVGVGAAVGGLEQAHSQLMMSVVAGRRSAAALPPRTGSTDLNRPTSGSSSTSTHQQAVQDMAARLQSFGADAVTLEHVLGRGGGGTVYLGKWRGLPVAVKTMVFEAWEGGGDDGGGNSNAAAAKSRLPFMRAVMETAISASLGHLHVVATYRYDIKRMDDLQLEEGGLQVMGADAAAADGAGAAGPKPPGVCTYKVFLVQELCTSSLRAAMDLGALHNEGQHTCLSLLHQVVCGLQYLHGLGIIHGDLTPGNILLKADSGDCSVIVKLADFGLSSRLEAQATHVSNFAAGTPFYVAPEVVTLKRTSPASDIFSFGVVAWEVLSGERPYVAGPDGAARRNPHFPHFPAGREPPPDLLALLHRCWSHNPRKRPTARELLDALDQALQAGQKT